VAIFKPINNDYNMYQTNLHDNLLQLALSITILSTLLVFLILQLKKCSNESQLFKWTLHDSSCKWWRRI